MKKSETQKRARLATKVAKDNKKPVFCKFRVRAHEALVVPLRAHGAAQKTEGKRNQEFLYSLWGKTFKTKQTINT